MFENVLNTLATLAGVFMLVYSCDDLLKGIKQGVWEFRYLSIVYEILFIGVLLWVTVDLFCWYALAGVVFGLATVLKTAVQLLAWYKTKDI